MNDEKMRVKIAEACGWTVLDVPVLDAGFAAYAKDPNGCLCPSVPDYLNDLNATHEMEKVLITVGDWINYVDNLSHLALIPNNATAWEIMCKMTKGDYKGAYYGIGGFVRATARQRCEAFLRTLGLWEDDV